MAYPTTLRRLVINLNGMEGPEYFQAGVAIAPGEVVTFDDADEVKLCGTTDKAFGVCGCDADHDLMTDYDAGERVPIWVLGCGVTLYVLCYDADEKTILLGTAMDSADATAGAASMMDSYVNASERTDLMSFVIGRAQRSGTLTAATVMFVPIKLSL